MEENWTREEYLNKDKKLAAVIQTAEQLEKNEENFSKKTASLWWPIAANQKNKNNKNQIKMKIKNWNNEKIYYSEKNPRKLSWSMSVKSDKKHFLFKKKKSTKLPWPMSAKSDT